MLRSFSTGRMGERSQGGVQRGERRLTHLGLTRRGSLKKTSLKPKLIRRVSSLVGLDSASRLAESDRELLALVDMYLRDLSYPQHLQKKVLKKFRKHLVSTGGMDYGDRKGSISTKTPAERSYSGVAEENLVRKKMMLHKQMEYEDGGALESDILATLPAKNRSECQWFLYGQHLLTSPFFHQLQHSPSIPAKAAPLATPFLRSLALGFDREHIAPGQYLSLAPRGKPIDVLLSYVESCLGALYVVRRGACRLLVNGKLEFVIKPGCLLECGVLMNGYLTVFRQEEKRAVFPTKNVSLCAATPRPSDDYMYGCELGVLSKEDFGTFLTSAENFIKCTPKEKEREKEKQVDAKAIRENLDRLRGEVLKQVKEQETAEEQLEIRARIKMESESRIAASMELEEACIDGSLPRIEEALLSGADIEFDGGVVNQRPIHICTKAGQLLAVKHLIKRGCNVSSQDSRGKSPLHLCAERSAVLAGTEDIASLLLQRGADLCKLCSRKISESYLTCRSACRDIHGNTPVHIAAARGDLAMIKLFRNFNSSIAGKHLSLTSISNDSGQSPVDVCREQVSRRTLKPKTNVGGGSR